VRRLFSTFAYGAPGAGLLLLRLAAGGVLLFESCAALTHGMTPIWLALELPSAAIGVLLLVGLWTPIVGALGAIAAMIAGLVHPADGAFYLLLATLGVALVLLGPGAWSLDARLFGWKRVEIPSASSSRKSPGSPPF
jgi:putative oxidoreductase